MLRQEVLAPLPQRGGVVRADVFEVHEPQIAGTRDADRVMAVTEGMQLPGKM